MKTSIFLVLFSFIVTGYIHSQTGSRQTGTSDDFKDIVDCYLNLPDLIFEYSAEDGNNSAGRKNSLKDYSVIIDRKNAYLQIKDTISELGMQVTVTYFKKATGEKVVAVSEYAAGGDCDVYTCKFLVFRNGEWKNITDEVLPEISFNDFWDSPDPVPAEKYMNIDKNIHWNFELPRYGTTVKVSPVGLGEVICFEPDLQSTEKFTNAEEMEEVLYKIYPETIRRRHHESLNLRWNKEKGIFNYVF
ncbi:MAG: hypothetical protein KJ607_05610 [Bacteroidetes bacterium]|nr:hypothetical protein [Bacteroidota bacterium]